MSTSQLHLMTREAQSYFKR